MVQAPDESYPRVLLFVTPTRTSSSEGSREREGEVHAEMKTFGYGRGRQPYTTLRLLSGVRRQDTCRLTYTDSEKFEPYLLDDLDQKWATWRVDWDHGLREAVLQTATKTIGWMGRVQPLPLKLGDGGRRHQGGYVIDRDEQIYMRMVPRGRAE